MSLLPLQNMKLVIFDFDGTIADTSPGILDSHRFALSAMGRDVLPDDELRKFIGGNLLTTYINSLDFSENDARKAVRIYRERYAHEGVHMAILYPGFKDAIQQLKHNGYMIGIATLKAESFAKQMVHELGIAEYIDVVCGMNAQDNLTKADLVKQCCCLCNGALEETVLVGDSNNDWIGATQAGVKFIGVTYGFGFKSGTEYEFCTVDKVSELLDILMVQKI